MGLKHRNEYFAASVSGNNVIKQGKHTAEAKTGEDEGAATDVERALNMREG